MSNRGQFPEYTDEHPLIRQALALMSADDSRIVLYSVDPEIPRGGQVQYGPVVNGIKRCLLIFHDQDELEIYRHQKVEMAHMRQKWWANRAEINTPEGVVCIW